MFRTLTKNKHSGKQEQLSQQEIFIESYQSTLYFFEHVIQQLWI